MPVNHQQERRAAIRDVLRNGAVTTQEGLIAALKRSGFAVTQSSVSRDLKELGAIKTASGYELPDESPADPDIAVDGIADINDLLRGLTPAGPNLLVIKTAIGAAQQVALALDQSGWSDVVGTVAGDDTVFAATAGAMGQRRLIDRMSTAA